ncbi:MAG: radical SAM protein [Bacteroidetes bacterium HGW-Bacteroidetes-22]|nr:MAG: radical SAM protein [Bacteroidetes bacterium HGW-Bacteroidetes-22]
MATRHYNIPVFVPEEGCPHRCIFCNQFGITCTATAPLPEEVPSIVAEWRSRFNSEGSHIELAFFGGSFTGIGTGKQEAYLDQAYKLKQEGIIHAIRLSTRPDYIDPERIERLLRYGVSTVELGAQSMDDSVLRASGRGHTSAQVAHATGMLQAAGIGVVLQMMTGLPGDTPEGAIRTAHEIIALRPEGTRIYPCLVMKGSPLEQRYDEGKYTPQSLEEAVVLAATLSEIFEESEVKVLRIGLHPSAAGEVVAGPWHPSFSELVASEKWGRRLLQEINPENPHRSIAIYCPPKQVNAVAGFNASNRKRLSCYFDQIRIYADPRLKGTMLHVDYL